MVAREVVDEPRAALGDLKVTKTPISKMECAVKTAAVLLTLEKDLFQAQILHLLHQVLMVKLNNYLKGIASPRQNIGR